MKSSIVKSFFLGSIFSVFLIGVLSAASGGRQLQRNDGYDSYDRSLSRGKREDERTISFYLEAINTSFDSEAITQYKDMILSLLAKGKEPTHADIRFVYWTISSPLRWFAPPIQQVRRAAIYEVHGSFIAHEYGYVVHVQEDCRIS